MGKFLAAVKARLTDSETERIRAVQVRSRARALRRVRKSETAMGQATRNRGLSLMPRMAGVAPAGPVGVYPSVSAGPLYGSVGTVGPSAYPPLGQLTNARLPALNLRDLTDAPAPNTRAIAGRVRTGRLPGVRIGRAEMMRMRR